MPGIYIMAVPTILGTAILCVVTLISLTNGNRRYFWLLVAGLPLSLIVNRLVKTPFISGIATLTNDQLKLEIDSPLWFIIVIWLNAPIFEEAIKAIPILFPAARGFLEDGTKSLYAGLALGLGFGLGEAAFIAYGVAQNSEFASLPWYVFTGYVFERIIVTFAHGFLTSLSVLGYQRSGRTALFGYLSAAGLHALINLGPILLALKLIPMAVSGMATYAAILGAFVLFQKNMRTLKKLSGTQPVEIIYFQR
jgi:uncharacterized membrane protein YhfC